MLRARNAAQCATEGKGLTTQPTNFAKPSQKASLREFSGAFRALRRANIFRALLSADGSPVRLMDQNSPKEHLIAASGAKTTAG